MTMSMNASPSSLEDSNPSIFINFNDVVAFKNLEHLRGVGGLGGRGRVGKGEGVGGGGVVVRRCGCERKDEL